MTNWFKGIDEALSTAGGTQVALAGYYFVDVINGDDSTGDGSPSNPWKTLTFAITQNVSSANYVLASGLYSETNLTSFNNDQILANIDGSVIFDSGSVANDSTFEGCVFKGFTLSSSAIDITLNSCVLDAITLNVSTITLSKTVAIAPTFTISTACSWGYSTITGTGTVAMSGNITVTNCDLGTAINFSGSNNALVSYSNNRPTTQTNITDSGNNIDLDPLYTGATADLELTIQTTSPLIGVGENGTTIGAFRVGELVDLSSPAENNDITVGATIELDSGFNQGNIKTAFKVLSQIRKSPKVLINGLPNNLDNIPDSDSDEIPPERRILPISYKSTVGGVVVTKNFMYGAYMFLDNSGNATGEDNFNVFDISSTGNFNSPDNLTSSNLIDVAEIQEDFVIRNSPIETLSGVLLWYNADSSIGDPVNSVPNLNIRVNNSSISDLEVPSGFLPPSLVSSEINGKSALKFGETTPEAIRTRTLTSFPSSVTAICLVKINEITSTSRILFISGNSSGPLRLSLDSSNRFTITSGSFLTGTSSVVLNGIYVVTSVFNGVNSKIRVNKITEATGDSGYAGGANYGLGRVSSNPLGQKFSAREFGLFEGDLIDDEPDLLEYIETYLMKEGGI